MQAHAKHRDRGDRNGNLLFHCALPLGNEDSAEELPFRSALGSNAPFAGRHLLTIAEADYRPSDRPAVIIRHTPPMGQEAEATDL